jgi:hypothetical protein
MTSLSLTVEGSVQKLLEDGGQMNDDTAHVLQVHANFESIAYHDAVDLGLDKKSSNVYDENL